MIFCILFFQVQGTRTLSSRASANSCDNMFPQRGLVGTIENRALSPRQITRSSDSRDYSRRRFFRYAWVLSILQTRCDKWRISRTKTRTRDRKRIESYTFSGDWMFFFIRCFSHLSNYSICYCSVTLRALSFRTWRWSTRPTIRPGDLLQQLVSTLPCVID